MVLPPTRVPSHHASLTQLPGPPVGLTYRAPAERPPTKFAATHLRLTAKGPFTCPRH